MTSNLPAAQVWTPPEAAIPHLTDCELEARLHQLTGFERRVLVLLLAHLAEFDARRLYAERGHPSLFAYCTQVLGYSEQGAYKRIQAARAARKFPLLLRVLGDGEINLTALVILAPHLREDNFEALLAQVKGKPTQEVERLAAGWAPRQAVPDLLRAQPAGANEIIEPLSAESFLFRFTGDEALRADFLRARDLLTALPPERQMEAIFRRALSSLLGKIDPLRREAPRRRHAEKRSRHIPRHLHDEVWKRDLGRCTFTDAAGVRCSATKYLEIDHIRPYALGGRSDDAANLRLACRAHNQLYARRIFGSDYP